MIGKWLSCLLICEGQADERFLGPLFERVIPVLASERLDVDLGVNVRRARADAQRADEVVAAMRNDRNTYDLVLYHHDGKPRRTAEAKLVEVRKEVDQAGFTEPLVPVIPIREIEAWMLADPAALAEVAGVSEARVAEVVQAAAHDVEAIDAPKSCLGAVIMLSKRRRRRSRPEQDDLERYYESIAERVDVVRLRRVPQFEKWWIDMTEALEGLNLL